MKNLLVTGNGFDLAHGLPVKYTDMLDALFEPDRYKMNHPGFPLIWLTDEIHYKCSQIELLEQFNELRELKGWAGFENELHQIISFFSTTPSGMISQQKEQSIQTNNAYSKYSKLKSLADFHSKKEFISLWKNLYAQVNEVCNYINLYLRKLNVRRGHIPNPISIKPIYIRENPFDYYLTFNYTDTYRKYFDQMQDVFSAHTSSYLKGASSQDHSQFIHGLAGSHPIKIDWIKTMSPLVLGTHDDFSNIDLTKDFNLYKLPFEKSFQRLQKRTGRQYREWFEINQTISGISKISTVIYGHSLDVADHDVLRYIIEHSETTKIYYLDQTDYEQKIVNLTKMYRSLSQVEDLFYSGRIIFTAIPT